MRTGAAVVTLIGAALFAVPVAAQQIVETSTGKQIAGHQCAVSEAFLVEIQKSGDARKADTRARLNAMLDAALASPKTNQTAVSPVVFPPRQPGS